MSAEQIVPLGGGQFVRSRRGLVRGELLVPLSPIELKLLLYFVEHPGEELTFRQLLTEVWGYHDRVESRTVYSTVNRLRSKIERDAQDPQHLLSVQGVGYRFVLAPSSEDPLVQAPSDSHTLVGRAPELAWLVASLGEPGVVALIGPGGVGKTRLAEEAARRAAPRLPGGVLRLELGAVSDSDGLLASVMSELGLARGRDAVEAAGQALAQRGRCVLWLDEVEALAGQLGALEAWRQQAPEATFLLTSRVPLELGEQRAIAPLDPDHAAALLVARGRAVRPALQDDAQVRALCEVLDGLPLALELAAARLGLLSPEDLRARLQRDLSVLKRRGSSGHRHDSLQATLAWSWELLDPPARQVLAGASVFVGGFDLEAAEAVLKSEGVDVLDELEALSACGLLRPAPGPGSRLVLLETVRAFAAQQLSPERRAEVERAHGAHYAVYGDEDPARPDRSSTRPEGQKRLRLERAQLEAATERALLRGDADVAFRAGFAVARLWQQLMPGPQTVGLTERVLAVGLTGVPWCRMAYLRGVLLWSTGRLPEAKAQLEAVAAAAPTPIMRAQALSALGLVLGNLGEPEASLAAHERSVASLREAGSPGPLARGLVHLGGRYTLEGRAEDAERALQEAVRCAQEADDPRQEAPARGALGHLLCALDRPTEGHAHALAGVGLAERCGDAREILSARRTLVEAKLHAGLLQEALEGAEDVVSRARALADRTTEGWAQLWAAHALLSAGRPQDAALMGLSSIDSFRSAGQAHSSGYASAITAVAQWRLGRHLEAERTAASAQQLMASSDDLVEALALATETACRSARGLSEGAPEREARARSLSQENTRWGLRCAVEGLVGVSQAARGEREEARQSLARVEQQVRERGWIPPGPLEVVLQVLRRELS